MRREPILQLLVGDHLSAVMFFSIVSRNPSDLLRKGIGSEAALTRSDVAISIHGLLHFDVDDRRVVVSVTPSCMRSFVGDITETPLVLSMSALKLPDLLAVWSWKLGKELQYGLLK